MITKFRHWWLLLALPLQAATLPEGFTLTAVADNVPNARQMAWGQDGTLFVGSRKEGKVYALKDLDNNGEFETRYLIAEALFMPSGLAVKGADLYVAAVNRILRFPNIEKHLASPKMEVAFDGLPSDAHHGWKFIRFAPDGRLIVPVGAPCNICDEPSPYASILSLDLAKGQYQVIARGVRNSVGFDFHPQTGELYFSDNGRDMMGDDVPADEINRLSQHGAHYGYPYRHGKAVNDPDHVLPKALQGKLTEPLFELQAHVAPLGVYFYRGTQFPEAYRGALFIAEHGSWNRSKKVGYQVTALNVDTQPPQYRQVVTGWLDGERPLARPVAFVETSDGSLLISDDYNGAIYKLSYTAPVQPEKDNNE